MFTPTSWLAAVAGSYLVVKTDLRHFKEVSPAYADPGTVIDSYWDALASLGLLHG